VSESWDDAGVDEENDWDDGEESMESELEDGFPDPEEVEGDFADDELDDEQ